MFRQQVARLIRTSEDVLKDLLILESPNTGPEVDVK